MKNSQEQPTRLRMHQQQQTEEAFATPDFPSFRERLEKRLIDLLEENAGTQQEIHEHFFIPVGFVLVLDKDNGGDATAEELVRRFRFLHKETGPSIDLYFLGWRNSDTPPYIKFDVDDFKKSREALEEMGVTPFRGYADLILVDVMFWYDAQIGLRYKLNFPEAMYVELGRKEAIGMVGEFLQNLIQAAKEIRKAGSVERPTYRISDKLGIAIARRSLLEYYFEKWGRLIGANKLEALAIRNVGKSVDFVIPRKIPNSFRNFP